MPLYPVPALLQTRFVELTSDVSATPTAFTFENLITLNMTTTGYSTVECHFSASTSNPNVGGSSSAFRLQVDNVKAIECLCRYVDATGAQSVSLRFKTGVLSAGSHTFDIDWTRDVGTLRCRPATVTIEHASLLLKEITV
jgi:hypothetical protein